MALKDETMASIGMLAIAASILMGRFIVFEVGGFSLSAFTEGLLSGVGLVLVFYSLLKRRRG